VANKQRAEVEIVGAQGHRYVFRLGSGAICRLEETLDLDVMTLFETLQKGKVRLTMVREFVKAAALWSDELTNDQANEVIDECGVVPLLNAMTDSILLTFNIPQTKDKQASDPPKPVRAKRAAGSGSSSGPQKLAS
jgi:hypothetical protein